MVQFLQSIKTGIIVLVMTFVSVFSPATPLPRQVVSETVPLIPDTPRTTTSTQRASVPTVATSTKLRTPETPVVSTSTTKISFPKSSLTTTILTIAQKTITATTTVTVIKPAWDSINEHARNASVNIICTSASGGLLNPVSGSGVFIDPRGVILVNAHLAQYFLIKDYPTKDFLDCLVRQGSPALPHFRAELLYISPNWVSEHYRDIQIQDPLGTGENDFALLLVSGGSGPSGTLPERFSYLEPALFETHSTRQPVIITAYPAGFLGGVTIQTSLFLSSAPAIVQSVYSFTDSTPDLISLGGSVVAQKGSSGAAVVDSNGKLVGIIVTTSDATQTSGRDLHAITLSYINRRLEQEIGVDLRAFLSGEDLSRVAKDFNEELAPTLKKLLIGTLEKQ